MALNIVRKGKTFVKAEATYAAADTSIAAADAVRTTEGVQLAYDPANKVTSAERKTSPGAVTRFERPITAGVGSFPSLLRPSGVLNTLPDLDPVLEAAFGSVVNVTLATTVEAAPAPTASVFTLASVTGLVKHGAVSVVIGTTKHVRFISDITGSAITVEPALPSAPSAGAAVKSGITYRLTTDNAKSLYLADYLPGFSREVFGWAVDRLSASFDGVEEPKITASGPAQKQVTPAQAEPGAFTPVGSQNPPNGMSGEFYVDDTLHKHKNFEFTIANGLALRTGEAGNDGLATESYRNGRREVTLNLATFAETEATLYDKAEAKSTVQLFRQNGRTEGNIVAVYAPRYEPKVPETTTGQEAADWNFQGQCLESADGENDEIMIAFL